MKDFDNFDRRFNRTRGFIQIAMIAQFIITIAIIAAVIIGIVVAIHNPDAIGQFFGKIVNGFNSAK